MSELTITRLGIADINVLKEALPRFRFTPLSHLPYLKREQVQGYWIDEIREMAVGASSATFVARIGKHIAGFAVCSESPWDTRVIGRRIGALTQLAAEAENSSRGNIIEPLVKETIRHAAKFGIECLTAKVHPRDVATIHALEQSGFLLMDTIVYYLFDLSRTPVEQLIAPRRSGTLSIRLGTPADLPEILEIAEKAFKNHFGRYNADPRMPAGAAKSVYREWARSSFGGWADWVIVAEIRGRVVGYAVWIKASALEEKHGLDVLHYNLGAIHPNFVGRGVVAALSYDGIRMLRMLQQNANHVILPTHVTHTAVHRLCLEFGGQVSGARHSFHKWLKP